MIALEFLIFESVIAENTQVFVDQINACFFLIEVILRIGFS